MPGNMEKDLLDLEPKESMSLLEREERCQKAMKAVGKAIFMRLVVCAVLLWAVVRSPMELWVVGLMLLVLLINLTGILPLAAELKKRRAEWKALLAEEE